MKLLAGSVIMVKCDDGFWRFIHIRPPCLYFNVAHQQTVAVTVDRTLGHLEHDVELRHIRVGMRMASGDHPGVYVLAGAIISFLTKRLRQIMPIRGRFSAQIALDYEKRSFIFRFDEGLYGIDGIVAAIHAEQQRMDNRQVFSQPQIPPQEFRSSLLAMLRAGTEFAIEHIPLGSYVTENRRIPVGSRIRTADPLFVRTSIVHGGNIDIDG